MSGDDPSPASPAPSADGAAEGAPPEDASGSSIVDGSDGADGQDGATGCVILGPSAGTKWTLLGDADFEPASSARLNLVQFQSRGGLVAPGRHIVGRAKVSFDFVVERPGSGLDPGEGFAFMWSDAPIALGGAGFDLGSCGLATGFAVTSLDTGFITLRRLSDCSQGQYATVNDFTDALAHHVEIEISATGHVRVFYGSNVSPTLEGDPPGAVSMTNAWVAFTASTSNRDALHRVRDVRLEFPDDPPCP